MEIYRLAHTEDKRQDNTTGINPAVLKDTKLGIFLKDTNLKRFIQLQPKGTEPYVES